ncbi:MAG: hypothetical protein KBD26_00355 [Candidatus Pacebacteria bacterium]|nr:hypothetical protein [Candidatus Paceibacterota bacterium]MBP9772265.1 hypothetical protein [Candidatus Paceibacterota bacterium]
MDEQGKVSATWQALEYEYRERKVDWYWALGIIAVSTCIASFIFKNYLFGIFIILASVSIAIFSVKKPDLVTYTIDEKGIRIGSYFFPYHKIKAFWIGEHESHNELIIHIDRAILPHITILIPENVDTDGLKEFLLKYMKEEELHEPGLHKILDNLGF